MRRIILISVILIFPFLSFSQRQVNLQFTMIDPANHTWVVENGAFYTNAIIKNLGPDTLQPGDEVKLQTVINNNVVLIGSSLDSFIILTQNYLAPNNSFTYASPPSIAMFTGAFTYCVEMTLGVNTTDSIIDPVSTNNNGCAIVHIIPLSVSSPDNATSLSLFPIPAKGILNWELQSTKQKQIFIVDLSGRLVFKESTEESKGQIHLDGVTRANYFFHVRDAEGRSISRMIAIE